MALYGAGPLDHAAQPEKNRVLSFYAPNVRRYSFGQAFSSGRSASGGCSTSSSGRSFT